MKNLIALLSVFILSGYISTNATTTTKLDNELSSHTSIKGYGNSFIFTKNGIEFSVFPDGQFDFNLRSHFSNVNININYNSGYDYGRYLQYDEFGAIIQIKNTCIDYDYYGRINQVGNIHIRYDSRGYVCQLGGLFVHYNRYNVYSHCTGFINIFNRHYVYRPWHYYYRVPSINYCVVYNRPYRQYYTPVRYSYTRPYANNHRLTTSVASRRGERVVRHRSLATRNRTTIKRNNQISSKPRRNVSTKQKNRTYESTPRPRRNITAKPAKNSALVRNSHENVTKPKRVVPHKVSRKKNTIAIQKPKGLKSRKYNKAKDSRKLASNSNRRR